MKFRTFALLSLLAGCALAQQQSDTTGPIPATAPGPNPLVTLATQFFEHDFLNVYGFADGVFDSNNPVINSAGQTQSTWGSGFEVGGGISASHAFSRDSQLIFGYQGAYRDYQSNLYQSGPSQSLNLGYSKRLTRHLSMNVGVGAGMFLYGGTFVPNQTSGSTAVLTNPFSPETRYLGANVGFTYMQTRRLSYSFFGSYYLNRYNTQGAINSNGVSGGASANYRLTARTTISGNYSHSYFKYQSNVGQDIVDQIGVNVSHVFKGHWSASVFGGVARSDASGITQIPVVVQVGNQTFGGYVIGPYHQIANIPSFSGSASYSRRHSVFSLSAGQGVAGSGNGYFLASRNIYLNGVYSYSWQHGQNVSVGGNVYRLSSVANAVSSSYSSAIVSASYSRMLIRYVGCFVRYDYNHWGQLQPFSGVSDNRFTFGVNFSSKGIPMTLF